MIAIRNRARAVIFSLVAIAASAATMAAMFAPNTLNEDELADVLEHRFSGVIRKAASPTAVWYVITLPPIDPVASGPRVFIVGETGRIIDSCPDIGDRPSFRDRWLPSKTERASVEEVLMLLGEHR